MVQNLVQKWASKFRHKFWFQFWLENMAKKVVKMPWSECWLSILILRVQRTHISFKSSFRAFEDAGCSWLEYGILILIWIWSLVFCRPMFRILALSLDLEGAKNIKFLKVLIWGFWGCWRFLTWVWYLDLDLDMITGLWYTYTPNFGSLSWFCRCKEYPCCLSPDLGLWGMLEVPDWGLASWSWFGYSHWSLIYTWSEFWLFNLILKVQRTSCPLSPHMGLWRTLEVPDWGLASWSWFGYGHYSLIYTWSKFWLSILILKVKRTSMSFKSNLGLWRMLWVPDWGLTLWS